MRRIHIGVLLAALASLIVTSIAVADQTKPSTATAVSAHFTATGNVKTTACVTQGDANKPGNNGNNGGGSAGTANPSSSTQTRGQLSGTSTSTDKRVNGPVRVSLRLVMNKSGLGFATGMYHVGKIDAELMAVVTSSNRLDGFLRGTKGMRSFAANFSATLAGSTLTGDLGAGSHTNTAIIGFGTC